MNDTSPAVEQQFRTLLLARSGAERLRMASGMFDSARRMMLASFPKDLSPEKIRQLLLARTYPEFDTSTHPHR
jgi:hypothetical protein